ncbi:histidine kinase [Streptococcus sp. NSJ-72]|nr:histidine kinase [Streptococcus sp. NSJ-72]
MGRDLHDSLGHTFAMLSLKTELVQQLLKMSQYEQAGKELAEVHDISKQSMADVRRIIDNLKSRTLHEELITIQTMLEMSDVRVHLDNQLNIASISPSMQSSITMILLELAANIIKHAQAKHCIIYLISDARNLILDVEDDGIGFEEITGKELHSICERLTILSGNVEILNHRKPTKIQVVIAIEE